MKGYYIITQTANGVTMLADRTKTQSAWWTADVTQAMVFRSLSAANAVYEGLKYNNPLLVSYDEIIAKLAPKPSTNNTRTI